ncbi:MAG: penicillin acylase family protein [Bacteroidia bacterium]
MRWGLLLGFLWAQGIEIWRDSFGVPHIYATTDAGCIYGLAWAQAEDRFPKMQYVLALARGKMGILLGKKGAAMDFFGHFIDAYRLVDSLYPTLPDEVRQLAEAYAQALNAYAEKHPHQVWLPELFPVEGKDIARGYVITLSSMVGLPQAMRYVLEGKPERYVFSPSVGSNAFATQSHLMQEKKTFLIANPHLPLEGVFSFYEAHLHSQEGWNFLGGFFPGTATPNMGTNPYLAWTFTFNWPDFVDIYRLKLHPKNKLLYQVGHKWETLQVRQVPLTLALRPLIQDENVSGWPQATLHRKKTPRLKVKRKLYYSRFGPVLFTRQGAYALRAPVERTLYALEGLYRMSKAQGFSSFYEALKIQGLPLFNLMYADYQDTIFYLFNALLPVRAAGYDWQGILPGDTSATLWHAYLPLQALPQKINPAAGWLFNTNNSPFACTDPAECLNEKHFPPQHAWHWNRHNNRELRVYELTSTLSAWNKENLLKIKYDQTYPKGGGVYRLWQALCHIDPRKAKDLAPVLKEIQAWDLSASDSCRVCALLTLAAQEYLGKLGPAVYNYVEGQEIPYQEDYLITSLRKAKKLLEKAHGTWALPLAHVQKVVRGSVSVGLSGMPEQLAPAVSFWDKKQKILRVVAGDTYIMVITFSPGQPYPQIETVQPFGSSDHPESPHFSDQLNLFVSRRFKTMSLSPQPLPHYRKTHTFFYAPHRQNRQ